MFIGPCIIVIVEELKTNLMSLVIFISLKVLQPAKRTPPNIIRSKPQHTTKREQDNRCGNPSTQLQAPEDGHINVRNMLSKK